MKNLIKDVSYLMIANLILFYIIQLAFQGTLIFEKIIASTIILILVLLLVKRFDYKRFSIILVVYISMNLLFVNIDRSKSFYILFWVENNKISISEGNETYLKDFPKIKSRINEYDFTQRIKEHEARGLISSGNGELVLTKTGKFILLTSDLLGRSFRLNGWVGFQ
jgi:hypothetical protein